MKTRVLPVLATILFALVFSAPDAAEAKTYKQCVKGITGLGFVARVKWYDAAKIKLKGNELDLPKASKTKKVAVWETECYSSSKPQFITIEAIGNETASTVVGAVVGVATGVAGVGLCIGGVAVTGVASSVVAPCVELAIGGATLVGETVTASLPDPGIFYKGYAKEVELWGTVWKPKSEISKRLSGLPEQNRLFAPCFGVKNAGTKDTLTIEFFEGNTSLGKVTQDGCDPKTFAQMLTESIHHWSRSTKKMTRFTNETAGEDALWIDYLTLHGQWSGKIAQWGKGGGKGYCLSKDPKDARPWGSKVGKSCYRKFRFDVASEKAYGYH